MVESGTKGTRYRAWSVSECWRAAVVTLARAAAGRGDYEGRDYEGLPGKRERGDRTGGGKERGFRTVPAGRARLMRKLRSDRRLCFITPYTIFLYYAVHPRPLPACSPPYLL